MKHFAWALLAFGLVACGDKKDPAKDEAPAAEASKQASPSGPGPDELRIVGHVDIPGQPPLAFTAKIDKGDEGYTGTIDIPMQGADDLPLEKITVAPDGFEFAIANGATWRGAMTRDGAVECSFKQGPAELGCEMKLVDDAELEAAAPERPQTPQPPFPYDTEDVTWSAGERVTLAGTIAKPKGAGPYPAVVLISGSGQQDRDESIMGHKPFLLLADRLARAGVASLRYDDRMIGGSKGDVEHFTMEDEAKDAASALAELASADGIDPERIGIIGHSSGGVIAPMVAASHPDEVAFLVLLAGAGVPGSKILEGQRIALMKKEGMKPEEIEAAEAKNRKLQEIVDSGKSEEEIDKELRAALAELGIPEAAVEGQLEALTSSWLRHFRGYDPAPTLAKVHCPVLVTNGDKDLQVLPDDNVPAIEAALKSGGNDAVTTKRFEGLNHLFQPAETGLPDEYPTIETTFDEGALKEIEAWIVEQTKPS